jgi:hypothetical protein
MRLQSEGAPNPHDGRLRRPVLCAISRVLPWVLLAGINSSVLLITSSTCASVMDRGASGRGSRSSDARVGPGRVVNDGENYGFLAIRPSSASFASRKRATKTFSCEQPRTARSDCRRIFDLNLLAAGAYLHFISKTQTRLFQVSNTRRQILHLKEHTVPTTGLLLTAIGHCSGPRCRRTAQD